MSRFEQDRPECQEALIVALYPEEQHTPTVGDADISEVIPQNGMSEFSANTNPSLADLEDVSNNHSSKSALLRNKHLAAGLIAITSIFGTGISTGVANAQEANTGTTPVATASSAPESGQPNTTIDSLNTLSYPFKSITEIKTDYDQIAKSHPDAALNISFSTYLTNSAFYKCGSTTHVSNLKYGRVPGSKNKIRVTVKRDIGYYSNAASIISDNPSVPGSPESVINYVIPCSAIVDTTLGVEIRSTKKGKNGKSDNTWIKSPGTKLAVFPKYEPSLIFNKYANSGIDNQTASQQDTVIIKLPKGVTQSDVKNKRYYPAITVTTKYKPNMKPSFDKDIGKGRKDVIVIGPVKGKSSSLKSRKINVFGGKKGMTQIISSPIK